jgi:hypothetical protein
MGDLTRRVLTQNFYDRNSEYRGRNQGLGRDGVLAVPVFFVRDAEDGAPTRVEQNACHYCFHCYFRALAPGDGLARRLFRLPYVVPRSG